MKFTKWMKWENRNKDKTNIQKPGIYAIVYRVKNGLENTRFSLEEDIVYFGMTNSQAGLKGRLNQFNNTLNGQNTHGGASRFMGWTKFLNSPSPEQFKKNLYVAVMSFDCNVKEPTHEDLVTMGEVCRQEYVCWSKYQKKYGVLPRFNDKKRSPKPKKV